MARTEQAELDRRIEQVMVMLIECASTAEIQQYAAQKRGWNVHHRTVHAYIAKARERLRVEWRSTHAARIAERCATLRAICRKALKARPPQYNAARRALDSLIRLEGLEPPRNIHVKATVEDVTPQRPPTLEQRAASASNLLTLARQRKRELLSKRIAASN